MSKRRCVITGIGFATSLGLNKDDVWGKIVNGVSGIGPIERFDTTEYTSTFGGELTDWTGGPHLDSRDCKRMDRFCQFGFSASIDAVTDSGIDFSKDDPERSGVIIGPGIGGGHRSGIRSAKKTTNRERDWWGQIVARAGGRSC